MAIRQLTQKPWGLHKSAQLEELPTSKRLEEVAREGAWALLLDTERWIHRRVERVEYTDSELLRWQFSVDFTVRRDFVPIERRRNGADLYYIPIALLRKWPPLMNLDVRNEAGCPIPLLTSEKNRQVDAAALTGLLPEDGVRPHVETGLAEIALATSIDRAKEKLTEVSEILKKQSSSLSGDEADKWLRIVLLATNLAWNSILWARVESQAGQRQMVKVSFEGLLPGAAPIRRRILAAFGIRGEWTRLNLHNLGERGSYHLEFTPPPGTEVLEARLHTREPLTPRPPRPRWWQLHLLFRAGRKRRGERATYDGPATKLRFRRSLNKEVHEGSSRLPDSRTPYSRNLLFRAHFYLSESSGQSGRALIRLGATRRGFLNGSFYAAFLTTLLLWFSYCLAEHLVEKRHQGGTVTALVFLPALLSYLFAQPSPHPVARRMIAGVRVITRTVTLLPVIAALIMLGTVTSTGKDAPDVGAIEDWWLILAVIASALTLFLAITAKALPRSAVGDLYGPPDRES